jgi:hypothetical protein
VLDNVLHVLTKTKFSASLETRPQLLRFLTKLQRLGDGLSVCLKDYRPLQRKQINETIYSSGSDVILRDTLFRK